MCFIYMTWVIEDMDDNSVVGTELCGKKMMRVVFSFLSTKIL